MDRQAYRARAAMAMLAVTLAWSSTAAASLTPEPVADAVAIAPGVEWRAGAAGSYTAVASSQAVATGDGVRTDATGFAEVAYADGSRTRLDVSTEFEVLELVDAAGASSTRTSMGLGRTWHRVESLGQADGNYSVETSQATATVTGTAFLVSCLTVESCDFVVVEGTVDVELADGTVISVVAPASLDVTNGVPTGPVPLTWDSAFGDPWLVANTDRDVAAGFADRVTVFQAYGPAHASMVGSYEINTTITEVTCTGACDDSLGVVGNTLSFPAEFSQQCDGSGCVLVGLAGTPYAFDGVTHRTTVPGEGYCYDDLNGNSVEDEGEPILDEWTGKSDVAIAPTAAVVQADRYVATAFQYHRVFVDDIEGILCSDGYMGMTITDDGTGTRVG